MTSAAPSFARPPRASGTLDRIWELADQCVPYKFLLFWSAHAPEGQLARTIDDLRHVDFIYSIAADFIAITGCRNNVFTPVLLEPNPRRSGTPPYRVIIGRPDQLLTPGSAELHLERYLAKQARKFWEEFWRDIAHPARAAHEIAEFRHLEHYRALPWQSLRLEWSTRSGAFEPQYVFRKAGSRCEFRVGAQFGSIMHSPGAEPVTPPPTANPTTP